MAIRETFVTRQVRAAGAVLAIDIAREIPVQVHACSSDARALRFGDMGVASLVGLLEQEGGVIARQVPSTGVEGVRCSVEGGPGSRMAEIGEVVGHTMDND